MEKIIKELRKDIYTKGIAKALFFLIRMLSRKITGDNKTQEEIDTLFYFLNTYYNASDAPKAEGDLRLLQLADVQLLRIFDNICKSNGIPYWIDFGTLLGARRHGGFIPWDDDMDVSMLRDDYERAYPILISEFQKYGISVSEGENRTMMSIGIGYNHPKTGIWLDVFPVDVVLNDQNSLECYDDICHAVYKYKKYYKRHSNERYKESLIRKKEKLFSKFNMKNGKYKILIHFPEFKFVKDVVHDVEQVFPLNTIEFEGYELSAPADTDGYLMRLYGSSFMNFPQTGILHHGAGRTDLSTWAKASGTNMQEVIEKLKEIADSISTASE